MVETLTQETELCFPEPLNIPFSYRLPLLAFFWEGVISQLNPGSALPGVTLQQESSGLASQLEVFWCRAFSISMSVLSGVCPVISASGHHWRWALAASILHQSEFTIRGTLQYIPLVWYPLWFFHVFLHPPLAALRRPVWNTWPPADKVTDGISRISDLNNILRP